MEQVNIDKQTFESHGDFDQSTISEKYNELSSHYEQVYTTVGWPDPEKTAEKTVKFGYNKDSEILDMGCGTGMVVMHLKNISGVDTVKVIGMDASDGMIEKAK